MKNRRPHPLAVILLAALLYVLYSRGSFPGKESGSAPINAPGFNALLVFDPASGKPLAGDQALQLTVLPDLVSDRGGEYRAIKPEGGDLNYEQHWRDARDRPRTSLPWLILSNKEKNTGHEGPLPTSQGETEKLLDKFAP